MTEARGTPDATDAMLRVASLPLEPRLAPDTRVFETLLATLATQTSYRAHALRLPAQPARPWLALHEAAESLQPDHRKAWLTARALLRIVCQELETRLVRVCAGDSTLERDIVDDIAQASAAAEAILRELAAELGVAVPQLPAPLLRFHVGGPLASLADVVSRRVVLSRDEVELLVRSHDAARYAQFCAVVAARGLVGCVKLCREREPALLLVTTSPLAVEACLEGLQPSETISLELVHEEAWLQGPEGNARRTLVLGAAAQRANGRTNQYSASARPETNSPSNATCPSPQPLAERQRATTSAAHTTPQTKLPAIKSSTARRDGALLLDASAAKLPE